MNEKELVEAILELCNSHDKRVPIDELKDLLREAGWDLGEGEDNDDDWDV